MELHQKDIILTETDLDDHSEQVISLKQYSETLREPDFKLLESEYHISRRLSLVCPLLYGCMNFMICNSVYCLQLLSFLLTGTDTI